MKRVKSACICQTLHFMLKEDTPHEYAVKLVREELAHYKEHLEKTHTKYKITDEAEQADGSVIIKVLKQYNNTDTGTYLD